jgi:hypothetical protein
MTHPTCRWVGTPMVVVGYNDRKSLECNLGHRGFA